MGEKLGLATLRWVGATIWNTTEHFEHNSACGFAPF